MTDRHISQHLQTKGQNKEKPVLPAMIRFTLLPSERDWVKQQADSVKMSMVAYIKTKIVGSHYDPNVRHVLLRLNRDLTLYGQSLHHLSEGLKQGTLPQERSAIMLEEIRLPLVEALQSLKRYLAQGMIFP